MKADRMEWIWFIFVSVFTYYGLYGCAISWFLFGLAVIFDMYITHKVNWTFWKKRNGENSKIIEWLDALILP
jgi:signal peptidase I